MAYVDEQGRLIPSYPAADYTPDPNFKEERSFPSGVFMPGGKINPNLIQMLAGIGAEMDPRGAGGIIGRATQNYTRNAAAQKSYSDAFSQYRDERNRLFDVLSSWGTDTRPLSPEGQRGVTSLKANPKGGVTITGNLVDEPLRQSGTQGRAEMATERPGMNRQAQENVKYATPESAAPGESTWNPADDQFMQGAISMLGGNDNGVIGYAPDGTPITTTKFKMAPLGPAMPREQLEAIPVTDNPTSTVRQLRPGQRNVPKQAPQEMQIDIEKQSADAPPIFPGSDAPLGTPVRPVAPRRTVIAPTINMPAPPTYQQPTPVQSPADQTSLIPGGGSSAPPNVNPLLPTPRRRMQTIPDIRDLVPFY